MFRLLPMTRRTPESNFYQSGYYRTPEEQAGELVIQWRYTTEMPIHDLLQDLEELLRGSPEITRRRLIAKAMYFADMKDEAAAMLLPLFDRTESMGRKALQRIGGLFLASVDFDPTVATALEEKFPNDIHWMKRKGDKYVMIRANLSETQGALPAEKFDY